MIRRKLDESYTGKINRLAESYSKKYTMSSRESEDLFNCLFEDVRSVHRVFVDNVVAPLKYAGHEIFEEVEFTGGDIKRFLLEYYNGKFRISEVEFTESMIDNREYL